MKRRKGGEPGAPAAQRDGCRDSSDAGEPAGLTTMSAAMHRYVEVVKQYPGQQQVDLAVEIEVPGSWFGVGPMGALTDAERREMYTAQAVDYAEVREFPGALAVAQGVDSFTKQASRPATSGNVHQDYARHSHTRRN